MLHDMGVTHVDRLVYVLSYTYERAASGVTSSGVARARWEKRVCVVPPSGDQPQLSHISC